MACPIEILCVLWYSILMCILMSTVTTVLSFVSIQGVKKPNCQGSRSWSQGELAGKGRGEYDKWTDMSSSRLLYGVLVLEG